MTDLEYSVKNYLIKHGSYGDPILKSIVQSIGSLGRNIKEIGKSVGQSKGLFGGIIDKNLDNIVNSFDPQTEAFLHTQAGRLRDIINKGRSYIREVENKNAPLKQRLLNKITGTTNVERELYKGIKSGKSQALSGFEEAINDLSNDPLIFIRDPEKAKGYLKDVLHGGKGNRLAAEALPVLASNSASFFGKNKRIAKELLKNTTDKEYRQQLKQIIDRDTKKQLAVGGTAAVGLTGMVGYKAMQVNKQKEAYNQQLKNYYLQNSRIRA